VHSAERREQTSDAGSAAVTPATTAECVGPQPSGSVAHVRCPSCADVDDKVVDSRMADDGSSIRRRRECLACGHRFTTFERYEEQPIVVVKRSGDRVPFDRAKIEAGVVAAAKGRPVTLEQVALAAEALEDQLRIQGGEVTSEQIGLAVLDQLREVDQVAYVRFASVYKGFDDPADFEREIGLLTKETAPKRH
jgi:transcriptional repressor NrdR